MKSIVHCIKKTGLVENCVSMWNNWKKLWEDWYSQERSDKIRVYVWHDWACGNLVQGSLWSQCSSSNFRWNPGIRRKDRSCEVLLPGWYGGYRLYLAQKETVLSSKATKKANIWNSRWKPERQYSDNTEQNKKSYQSDQ